MTILWSIVPTEYIFQQNDEKKPELEEIEVGGVRMVVQPDGKGMARIERLISANPRDFLKPEWQPGQSIAYPHSNV